MENKHCLTGLVKISKLSMEKLASCIENVFRNIKHENCHETSKELNMQKGTYYILDKYLKSDWYQDPW